MCPLKTVLSVKYLHTISILDPSGTGGPQLTPRNGQHPGPGPGEVPHHFPPKQDLPVIDESRIASARPVIVAQIPPPPHRAGRPPGQVQGPPPPQQVKRNAPVRSQSMGMADTGRFFLKPGHQGVPVSGPPPRFRPPPPPEERRPVMSRRVPEYHDTSSDGEDILYDPIVPDYRSWDRRKTNYAALNLNQKYKTLEPRSKSGGDAHSLERLNPPRSGPGRVLPEVPSHSLPRQGKRAQSDSRSRDRGEAEAGAKRSQSHGDNIEAGSRRRLPQVPGGHRDLREPTPDYDSSSPPGERRDLRLRRNSDSGLLDVIDEAGGGGAGVKRHASNTEKTHGKKLVLNSSFETSNESDESKGKIRIQKTQ